MNNYCWYCGKKLNKNDKNCSECDALVFDKRVNVEERGILANQMKQNENTLFFITLGLPILSVILVAMDLAALSPIALVGFLICLVFLRKKYHYSLKVKILTSLACICVLVAVVFIIWICVECGIIHPGL